MNWPMLAMFGLGVIVGSVATLFLVIKKLGPKGES
jgi:uncharacterized membrane protein